MRAVKLNKYKGKQYYRIPVRLRVNTGASPARDPFACVDRWFTVVAQSAADAANLVKDEFSSQVSFPLEVFAFGPKGGEVYRYTGWEGLIAARMWNMSPRTQMQLLLQG